MTGGGGGGVFFFQAEYGIRDAQESRGLGDVYKRQALMSHVKTPVAMPWVPSPESPLSLIGVVRARVGMGWWGRQESLAGTAPPRPAWPTTRGNPRWAVRTTTTNQELVKTLAASLRFDLAAPLVGRSSFDVVPLVEHALDVCHRLGVVSGDPGGQLKGGVLGGCPG